MISVHTSVDDIFTSIKCTESNGRHHSSKEFKAAIEAEKKHLNRTSVIKKFTAKYNEALKREKQ